jgi:hypothetical protein
MSATDATAKAAAQVGRVARAQAYAQSRNITRAGAMTQGQAVVVGTAVGVGAVGVGRVMAPRLIDNAINAWIRASQVRLQRPHPKDRAKRIAAQGITSGSTAIDRVLLVTVIAAGAAIQFPAVPRRIAGLVDRRSGGGEG